MHTSASAPLLGFSRLVESCLYVARGIKDPESEAEWLPMRFAHNSDGSVSFWSPVHALESHREPGPALVPFQFKLRAAAGEAKAPSGPGLGRHRPPAHADAGGAQPARTQEVAEQPRKEDRIRTAARAMLDGVVG
eukprot:g32720.t1